MYGYRLSLVSMLIPTNDTFVGANMMLPGEGGMMGYAYAYDAGTEMNDELCSSIPNPAGYPECDAMGAGAAVGMGEGGIVIRSSLLASRRSSVSLRMLTEISLPCPKRADQEIRGCASSKSASL